MCLIFEKTWKALFKSIRQEILVLKLRVGSLKKKKVTGGYCFVFKSFTAITQRPNKAGVGSCFADDSEFSDKFKD